MDLPEGQTEFKLLEVAKIIDRSPSYVRRRFKEKGGPYQGHKIEGVWYLGREALSKWFTHNTEKDTARVERILNPEIAARERRPSHVAVRMISHKVRRDPKLTDAQRALFLSRLKVYQEDWDARYNAED